MSIVKFYAPKCVTIGHEPDVEMGECEDGDWVLRDRYDSLSAECADLREDKASMKREHAKAIAKICKRVMDLENRNASLQDENESLRQYERGD